MQVAVIEFCRNVLGIENANSKEFSDNCTDVITTMDDTDYTNLGGTLRLGTKQTLIKDKNSLAYKIYGSDLIFERHRHRYEVNPKFINDIQDKGMIFSGKDPNSERMNTCEIPNHPYFFGTQYHPEFKTNPFHPTPIFYSFLLTSSKQFDKFKLYVKNRLPGISEFENESVEDITSQNEKYGKIINSILSFYKKLTEKLQQSKCEKEEISNLLVKVENDKIKEELSKGDASIVIKYSSHQNNNDNFDECD
jgi:hypothetical protein